MSEALAASLMALQRGRRRLGKFHGKPAGAQVAPELLAKQHFNIGLVIDHENEKTHARPPVFSSAAALRGRTILNSVNLPGSVSTAIVPECCFTMMSWLMERPSPVPSPAGLVVKNGLNIFSFTSGGMPVPLSRILISTRSPRFLVDCRERRLEALAVGLRFALGRGIEAV